MVKTSLERAIYWLLRSPRKLCHAKPKTQINRRWTLPASSRWWGCLPQAAWPERLSPKSQDAVALQQIKECGALTRIDRGDIRQAIEFCCSNIWASLPGAGYGQFEHKAGQPSCKFKEAGGTGQRDDVWAESPRLSPLCHSHHRLPAGLLIITVITPLPTKPSATKMPENPRWQRGNYWHADASISCARCKIHEGVSWC